MSKQAVKQISKSKNLEGMSKRSQDIVNRHEEIAREAYLSAEKRGFQGGDPLVDWLEAEAKVDGTLKAH